VTVTGTAPDPERGIRVERVSVVSNGKQLAGLVGLVDAGKLTLRVAETYRFAEAADAHRRAERGRVRGRLVLVP
jgi:NADPH:quinone reductase-like Zn-dependent oxidoreductase